MRFDAVNLFSKASRGESFFLKCPFKNSPHLALPFECGAFELKKDRSSKD